MKLEFKPGFRISAIDCVVILIAIAGVVYFIESIQLFSQIIAFVVVHFFLFCNVFRMSRPPELIWATTFLTLSTLSIQFDAFPIAYSFAVSSLLTVALVSLEIKKAHYHGVLWTKLNPDLEAWFNKKKSTENV